MTVLAPQRHLFDMPRNVHYFNCAYMSPLAREVSAAIAAGAARKSRPWDYRPADFFSYPEAFRSRASALVGAAADDIAIVPSASYGLAVAALNLPLRPGQTIIVLADQFPSNVYVWRDKAVAAGGRIVTVQRDAAASWTPAVLDAIGPDTGIVAIPNCHWADGHLVDLVAVGEACRKVGAALVLDLTQSLGALPFDVAAVRPDFMVAATYKWLMGPYGCGLLYADPRYHAGRPLEENWINREGAEDFARLVDYRDDYKPGARRFDMGEKSNPPLLLGATAALDMLAAWGIANIAETLAARTAAIGMAARALGFTVPAPGVRAPHFLSIGFPAGIPDGLIARLAAANVFASQRGDQLRVTPHLYNDDVDIAALVDVLKQVQP
jgi:selenocysteine lyase/cysteine desulfurase